jgi:glycosyltransferase involved in cell wall biosynthesis
MNYLRVCHFGGYNRDYSRNVVLRKALRRQGVHFVECHSRHPSKWRRYVELAQQYSQVHTQIDVILVGTVSHRYMPLAYWLGKLTQKPVVFDVFDSQYEAYVYDFRDAREGSLKAYYYALLDKFACALADLVVLDTPHHAEFFAQKFRIPWDKLRWVPVGTDTDLFFPRTSERDATRFHVLFVGSFNYLHGVDTIVRAAFHSKAVSNIAFTLLGRGRAYEEVRQLAASLEVSNIDFMNRVPYQALPEIIASADVVLGVFGDTPKTLLVVPNKVYEALAMGKPLVTGDTPAIQDLLTNGVNALLCPLGDDQKLAELLLQAQAQPEFRCQIGQAGFELFQDRLSLEQISRRWINILEEAVFST